MPVKLSMLRPEYISELYERVQKDEEVFRNILVDLARTNRGIKLSKKSVVSVPKRIQKFLKRPKPKAHLLE